MADRPRYYVALGDSMSIDAYAGGPGRGAVSLLYKNRDDDFPEWAGRDLSTRLPGVRLIPLAADGATSAAVRFAQIPRLREMAVRPALATVTFGGNDLLQTFGSDDTARAAHRALWENGHAILGDLRAVLEPGAHLIVGTIYDPTDGTGDLGRLGFVPWPGALDWLARFNETLRALADEHGGLVADIHSRFLGHGIRAGDPTQGDARPANRDLWYCGTIEPNAWGAGGIRAVFYEALETAGAWAP